MKRIIMIWKRKDTKINYTLDIEDCIKEYINNDIEKQILSKNKNNK